MSKKLPFNQPKNGVCSKKIADYLISQGFERKCQYGFNKEFDTHYWRFYIAYGQACVTIGINKSQTSHANVFFPYKWVLASNLVLVKRLLKETIALAVHELNKEPVSVGLV